MFQQFFFSIRKNIKKTILNAIDRCFSFRDSRKTSHFLSIPIAILKNNPIFAPEIKIRGAIAQLVEQRTENPCVPGSIPGGTT